MHCFLHQERIGDIMTDLIFSTHALKRMEERNISKEKIEQIIECGNVYGGKEGKHVIKYTEIYQLQNYFFKEEQSCCNIICF